MVLSCAAATGLLIESNDSPHLFSALSSPKTVMEGHRGALAYSIGRSDLSPFGGSSTIVLKEFQIIEEYPRLCFRDKGKLIYTSYHQKKIDSLIRVSVHDLIHISVLIFYFLAQCFG